MDDLKPVTNSIPLSLYIHFPWCVKKCPYCDFNSHQDNGFDEAAYIDALLQDLKQEAPYIHNRSIHSIFMGGGTPSLFSPQGIDKLLNKTSKIVQLSSDLEITMEANPGTVERSRFEDYRKAGINRLSIGIQSFNDQQLKNLGRIHDSKQAKIAIDEAKNAGFENFNLDLMHGLPNQTIDSALSDLQIAIECEPQHLSWYQLTLEPNTIFAKYPPKLPEDDNLFEIEKAGLTLLKDHHYQRYEISAYCKDDNQCQHNLNYWQFGDYVGIGAGAHGKFTHDNKIIRREKKKLPQAYLDSKTPFLAKEFEVPTNEKIFEYMLNRLRLIQPLGFTEIIQRAQCSTNIFMPIIKDLEKRELITLSKTAFAVTEIGFRFLNDVINAFESQS